MDPAPRGRRVSARLVDLVVAAWLAGVLAVEVGSRFLDGDPLAARVTQPVSGTAVVVALLLAVVALEVIPTAIWGRTVGKALLGLRVVPADAGDLAERDPAGRPPRVGLVAALLRPALLLGPVALPYAGPGLALLVGASALVLPRARGLHDLVAGTTVVDASAGAGGAGPTDGAADRHRYPRRAVASLPLPEVAIVALTEVGVPERVPGAFEVDPRMAVYDEILFSVGEDPHGRALCVLSPSGEVVAVDPEGTRPPLLAGTSLPRFLDALDELAGGRAAGVAGAPGAPGAPGDGVDPEGLRRRIEAVDPEAVGDPSSWWPTVWG
jgi:uncharacterized RDD family membrane protein YckC